MVLTTLAFILQTKTRITGEGKGSGEALLFRCWDKSVGQANRQVEKHCLQNDPTEDNELRFIILPTKVMP